MLLVVAILPHNPIKKGTTHSGILVSLVEYLVIGTLAKLVDSSEITYQQGDLSPIEENLDGDEEDFKFYNKEQSREEEHPNYIMNLNS